MESEGEHPRSLEWEGRKTMKKWTKKEIETHIKKNVKDYSACVVVAGLYKKIYGEFPKIGLSGFQGEGADFIVTKLPDRDLNPRLGCATTKELMKEIYVRAQMDGRLDYKTIDSE